MFCLCQLDIARVSVILINKRSSPISYSRAVSLHGTYWLSTNRIEWRRKLRIWNAWRTYILRSRSDRETRALNEEMKERHR